MKAKKTKQNQTKTHKPFNLQIKTEEQARELMANMAGLKMNTGWLILQEIMRGNIAVMEAEILTKRNAEDGSAISNEQCDELRYKRSYMEELIRKPDDLMKQFQKEARIDMPIYDPYASETDAAKEKAKEYAHTLSIE